MSDVVRPGEAVKNIRAHAFVVLGALNLLFFILIFPSITRGEEIQVTFGATNFHPDVKKEEIFVHYDRLQCPVFKELGATSFESYVRWSGIEKEENKWDFSIYDAEVEYLKKYNLKWVPFLIAGPAYTTPDWFKKSDKSLFYKCLEHQKESEVQSIWNPHLEKYIERFIKKFAGHYAHSGVIESVLVGITGDFGEAIYPVSGGGWTGNYHQHAGFWSADRYALEDFQRFLSKKYKKINNLNKIWQTQFNGFEKVSPFLIENSPSGLASLDQIEWYRDSMNRWVEFWLKTTKKYLPAVPVYLCTGGDGHPHHGSDFSKQTKIAAKLKCGVRITNEGSYYPLNFILTRWVASAGKFYKTFYGFEPASGVSKEGLVNRIYNVASSGAVQLFEYSGNITQSEDRKNTFKENLKFLTKRKPVVKVAAFIPTTYLALNHQEKWWKFFGDLSGIRQVADFDFLDENMIEDGALNNYEILFTTEGNLIREKTRDKTISFIKKGGILFGHKLSEIKTLEGNFLLPPEIRGKIKIEKIASIRDVLKLGKGYVLSTMKRAPLGKFKEALSTVIYHADEIDGKYAPVPFFNNGMSDVYSTCFTDGFLILNASDKSFERDKIKVEPHSIFPLTAILMAL